MYYKIDIIEDNTYRTLLVDIRGTGFLYSVALSKQQSTGRHVPVC